jgi:hypothetical protein
MEGPQTRLFFSRLGHDADILIYSEAGREVRALRFTPDSLLWSWDLKDTSGRMAKQGLYYFRESGGLVAPFVLY